MWRVGPASRPSLVSRIERGQIASIPLARARRVSDVLRDPARCRRIVAGRRARTRPERSSRVDGGRRARAVRGGDGLGDRIGGLVLDLRRAGDHRHRGLARGDANAADRGAEDRARRSAGTDRDDGPAPTARPQDRRGTRMAAGAVATWVILADTRTNRRHVARHGRLLRGAFPANGHGMRRWLRKPEGAVAALSFLPYPSDTTVSRDARAPRRVSRAGSAATRPRSA